MITGTKQLAFICLIITAVLIVFLVSCQKDVSSSYSDSSTIAMAASQAAAVSAGGTTDSVYIIQPCPRGYHRDSISETDLPASVTDYLAVNYAGYVFYKAFIIVNNSGAATAYVIIIYYNDKPVAIQFDSNGDFVKVLEQREKGDLNGRGWHESGRFCDRDGLQKDSVALNALPSSIVTYMATNFPQDTLIKAFKSKHDSSYLIISRNNGLFATVFDVSGTFIKRITVPAPGGNCVSIPQADLPSNVLSYLNTSYPNYIFEKAFAVYSSNVLQCYIVVINANNTKYAVRFDASGIFVSVKTIW